MAMKPWWPMDGKQEQEISRLRFSISNLLLDLKLLKLGLHFKAGFRPDQPRVPAGSPDGGQWTDEGIEPTKVSSRGPRETAPRRISGRWTEARPAQVTRLQISNAQMQAALREVRRADPRWKPTPQAYETIEGEIAANEATTREAEARLYKLQGYGIGTGRYADESIPARGSDRNFTAAERAEINRIGRTTGCHTCGTKDPGTPSGNFIPDHQLPSALNRSPARQSLYPHCLTCSLVQGGWTRQLRRGR